MGGWGIVLKCEYTHIDQRGIILCWLQGDLEIIVLFVNEGTLIKIVLIICIHGYIIDTWFVIGDFAASLKSRISLADLEKFALVASQTHLQNWNIPT